MHSADIQVEEIAHCLFNESNDALFLIDPESLLIVSANPAAQRITQLPQRELAGRRLDSLLVADQPGGELRLTEYCQQTRFSHSEDGYRLKCHEDEKVVNISVSRLHGATKTWSMVVVRDLTSRARLEDSLVKLNRSYEQALTELQQSQETIVRQEQMRAVGQLAAGVAHDLNNLFCPVFSYCELLLADGQLQSELRSQVELIYEAIQDAAASVKNMATYRVKEPSQFLPVDVGDLIRELPDLTRPRWRSQQQVDGGAIDFQISSPSTAMCVFGDKAQLRQVLLNLVINAVDALPEGGAIHVTAERNSTHAMITVKDDGVGMSPEQLTRITEPFYTTKKHGTGLGLNLAKSILDRHGGNLVFESQCGRGTVVTLTLPVSELQPHQRATVLEDPGPIELSVLCIDDDQQVLDSLVRTLVSFEVDVDHCVDGQDAIGKLRQRDYDAVITDFSMPHISGVEILREAQRLQKNASTCIWSAWNSDVISRQLPDDVNCDCMLSKPVSRQQILAYLAKVKSRKLVDLS